MTMRLQALQGGIGRLRLRPVIALFLLNNAPMLTIVMLSNTALKAQMHSRIDSACVRRPLSVCFHSRTVRNRNN